MEWNEAKNERRCMLLAKGIHGELTRDEAQELSRLQEELVRTHPRVIPADFVAMNDLYIKDHVAIQEQAQLVQAMEFLVSHLTDGPFYRSALQVGWVARGIPYAAILQAANKLKVRIVPDDDGNILWTLTDDRNRTD